MSDEAILTEDQQQRITATLARIRAGLDKYPEDATDEPAHIFIPEVLNDKKD